MKSESNDNEDTELRAKCLSNDVVLATYPVLARDIHHAEGPTKSLRHEKRYLKRLSPLTQLEWWRVILDEAQMIESGVSNAAKVAALIPRENAWCVSGTPARTAKDLLGLLTFLHYEPYCSLPSLWPRLIGQHRDVLHSIFRDISLRHTKSQIRDEMVLPPQKRVIITVPFTHIEEQHYSSLFHQMAEECGLDIDGTPVHDGWDPNDGQVTEIMRTWLVRLRQTCLHPEVGSRNRKALGSGKGPLRSVAEVLEVMIDQNETAARSEERNLLMSQIRRGQILEHAERTQEALTIWLRTLEDARKDVRECRQQLQIEVDSRTDRNIRPSSEVEADSRTGACRHRLRSAIEIEHVCVFFIGNAYYQMKTKELASNAADTEPSLGERGSPAAATEGAGQQLIVQPLCGHARELEQNEESYYEMAKALRRELLADARKRAETQLSRITVLRQSLAQILPVSPIEDRGGLQIRQYYDRAFGLIKMMQEQSDQLIVWRAKSIELLTTPLLDEEETELKGDEYEASTKQQDEVYVYVDALRALVSDRHVTITGQENILIDHEMGVLLREALSGNGHAPQLLVELLKKRQRLKSEKTLGSLRSLITELRELRNSLRSLVENGNARAASESLIANEMYQHMHRVSSEQQKVVNMLGKEVELFRDAMNIRLEYYRQLQAISDQVAPYEVELSDIARRELLNSKEQTELQLRDRIASLRSKGRYLLHLREETRDFDTPKTCIICTSPLEMGILTSCGHTFCSDCLRLWWGQHRNCKLSRLGGECSVES